MVLKTPPKRNSRSPRKLFVGNKLKCSCDHQNTLNYKEEDDKRYFKTDDRELFGTKYASYKIPFAGEISAGNEAIYVPDCKNITQFCSGCFKYKCKHGYCHVCYLKLANKTDSSRPRQYRKTVT